MRYSQGVAVGGGLADAIKSMTSSALNKQAGYESQMNNLVDRDYKQSSIEQNLANAAYKNLERANLERYNNPAFVRHVAQLAKEDPTLGAYYTSLARGGDWGHVGGLLTSQQDVNMQDLAMAQAAAGNRSGANQVNLLREKGGTSYQGFSNGAVMDKATGAMDISNAIRLAAENAKNSGSGSGYVKAPESARISSIGADELIMGPYGTQMISRRIPKIAMDNMIELGRQSELPVDSDELLKLRKQLEYSLELQTEDEFKEALALSRQSGLPIYTQEFAQLLQRTRAQPPAQQQDDPLSSEKRAAAERILRMKFNGL